jgi:hypothetical protein
MDHCTAQIEIPPDVPHPRNIFTSIGRTNDIGLPVDLLKIERSFIKGLPDDHTSMTLTRIIIGRDCLAHLSPIRR